MEKRNYTFSQIASGILAPVLVLGIAGLGYFLLLPKFKDIGRTREVLGQKQRLAEERGAHLSQALDLVAEFATKQQDLDRVEGALPGAPRIPELLANLEFLARQSGLLVANIDVKSAITLTTAQEGRDVTSLARTEQLLRQTENLGIMDITMEVRGTYANIGPFLANVEQNLRLLSIQNVSFGEFDVTTRSQEFVFKLLTFYQK
jgi:Tfp pilus assembly protein PilO